MRSQDDIVRIRITLPHREDEVRNSQGSPFTTNYRDHESCTTRPPRRIARVEQTGIRPVYSYNSWILLNDYFKTGKEDWRK